jgi:dTDP-glucose pyrophosphorylase
MKSNIEKIFIEGDMQITEAMKLIGQVSQRILLVIDKKKKLLGSITDGDLRRSIIRDNDMSISVSRIMNKTPTTITKKNNRNEIIKIMTSKNLLAIPVIDDLSRVIEVKTLLEISQPKVIENRILIMAGGFGTRLLPLTKETPKPLLKVEKVPLLESLIKKLKFDGFDQIIISTHYKAEMIKDYFGDGGKWNVSIKYLYEKEPLGTAGSLNLLSKESISNKPFLVLNSDLVTNLDFKSLIDFHNEQENVATICSTGFEYSVPYGVIKSKNGILHEIIEKPKQTHFVNAGVYVFNPKILGLASKFDGKVDMNQLITTILDNKGKIGVFPIHEYWLDVGQIDDFNQAKIDLEK